VFPFSLFLGRLSWASDGVWSAGCQKMTCPFKLGSHFAFHLYSEGKSSWHGVLGVCTLLGTDKMTTCNWKTRSFKLYRLLRDVTCMVRNLVYSRLLPSHDGPYTRVRPFGLGSLELVFEVSPTAEMDNDSSIQPNGCAEKPEKHSPKP
jgi:hypothetical protein